ncbi:MAG TPA: AAA family ATPase [Solirubrobacteraceae bacterium]|jgi:GTPase SAR1 family protein|nr:AAA family ATPase [Solirubrobacteraceae bacterium]
MQLLFPSDAVVVVAGVPGAGKTTLIRRAVDRSEVRVVDTDDRRGEGRRPRLYAGHYARIVGAILGRRPAVIHSRGTLAAPRRAIALLARLSGRRAHLVLLDAPRAAAEAGQRRRGRTVPEAEMERQVARWGRLMARIPTGEGWASVVVLNREQAAATSELAFIAPVTGKAAAATM